MSANTKSASNAGLEGRSLLSWLTRKIAPALFFGGFGGVAIALLATHSPSILRALSILAAVLFGLASIIYFYWAACPNNGNSFRWSTLERIGIVVSGLAALGMAVKLAFPYLMPGSHFLYFVGALILAFVVRPILENLAFDSNSCAQGIAPNHTPAPLSKSEYSDSDKEE